MEQHASTFDLEAGKAGSGTGKRTASFLEAAALLSLWSILVINEGAIRLIDSNPSVDLLAGGRPPKFFPFLGGIFEVAFGLLGLYVGLAAFFLKWHSTLATKVAMVLQTILGYYVFVVFVFLIPGFAAADITEPSLLGLTVGQSKFIAALGILTSFHFCLALQGGQFLFMARLVSAATGQDFLKQNSGLKMRAVFWNANMGLSGLWTFITGAVVRANVGGGRLSEPFQSPPNVGVLPAMTIFTGLMLMTWALVGIALVLSGIRVPGSYYFGTGLVYVYALLNFTIVQLGLIDGAPSGVAALHAGLVFMTVFLGPYFVNLATKEVSE